MSEEAIWKFITGTIMAVMGFVMSIFGWLFKRQIDKVDKVEKQALLTEAKTVELEKDSIEQKNELKLLSSTMSGMDRKQDVMIALLKAEKRK